MTQLIVSGREAVATTREIGERADELDRDRADAASAADDENRGGRARHRLADIHAVEQGFPRGDRCERQSRGLGKSDRARLVPDNALVDEMKLSVGARTDVATRIEDLIARPEERSLWARLDDDARRIVADHFCGAGRGSGAGAHLVVHRVHRNGADLDQKIAPRGGWAGQLDVYKTIGRRNGAWSEISDRAHGCVLSRKRSTSRRCDALCK